jgi:hypothetical protein
MVAAAAALEHQGAVGVVWIEKFRHGKLALLRMLRSMQTAGQKRRNACQWQGATSFRGALVDAV